MRKVVVTGIGISSPIGQGVGEFWKRLSQGDTGLVFHDDEQSERRIVGLAHPETSAIVESAVRHRSSLKSILNRTFELLATAGALASQDAGLANQPIQADRLSIVVGIGGIEQYTEDLIDAARSAGTEEGEIDFRRFIAHHKFHPLRRLKHLPNIGTTLLSIEHQAKGPGLTLVGGVISGLQAIIEAHALIKSGRTDAAICGGADSRVSPFQLSVLRSEWELSNSQAPDNACRPFDRDRTGIVVGEGAALLVLEELDSALERRARPYAELLGGVSMGSGSGKSCADAMFRTINDNCSRCPDVVIAHGDGSVDSDLAEAEALEAVFNSRTVFPVITSVKGAIGHTMAASGVFNAATACLIIQNKLVPKIRSLRHPLLDLPFVSNTAVQVEAYHALANALDPTGAAASVLFARPML